VRARALAFEIEELLAGLTADEIAPAAYQVRLAQGLTRSLLDQLDELERGPSSSRKIPVAASSGVVEPEPGYRTRSVPGK
jgi:hypothetical protein